MRWQLFTLIAALLVMTISATPSNVAAGDAFYETKKMRVAAVVGVGTTQKLNLYYVNVHPAVPHQSEPGIQGVTIVLQNPNPTDYEGVCAQMIHSQVNVTPGSLSVLSLAITSEEEGKNKRVLLNGVAHEPQLGACFDETNRVVYIVGDLNAFEFSKPASAASIPLGRPGGIMIYDVTDPSGATAASEVVDLFGGGVIFLDVHEDS